MTAKQIGSMFGVNRPSTATPPSESVGSTARGREFGEIVDILKSAEALTSSDNEGEPGSRDFPKRPMSDELSLSASLKAPTLLNDHLGLDCENPNDESVFSFTPIDEEGLRNRKQSSPPAFSPQVFYYPHIPAPLMNTQTIQQLGWTSDGSDGARLVEDISDNFIVSRRGDSGASLINQSERVSIVSCAIDQSSMVSSISVKSGARNALSSPASSFTLQKAVQSLPLKISEGQAIQAARQPQQEDMFGDLSDGLAVLKAEAARSRNPTVKSTEKDQWRIHDVERLPESARTHEFETVMSDIKADRNIPSLAGVSESPSYDEIVPPTRIHVTELTTHFPIVIANSLPGANDSDSGAPIELTKDVPLDATSDSSPNPKGGDRVRILRFKISPAELGELLVKMRIHDSRVEIEIEAQSVVTTEALNDARDALSNAIEHKGMILNAFDITTQSNSNTLPAGRVEGPLDEGNQARNPGQGGAFNGDRPQQGQRETGSFSRNAREGEDNAPVLEPHPAILL